MINSFPLKFWFVRALLLLGVLAALQIFPIPGIFMMMVMAVAMAVCGPYVVGLLPHIVTLGFLVDIKSGKLPKIMIVIPVIAYSAGFFVYYSVYEKEGKTIEKVEAQLKAENPDQIIKFDPFQQSLVLKNAFSFAESSKVPVVYEQNPNFAQGYLSYRLIPRDKCEQLKSAKIEREELFNIMWRSNRNDFNRGPSQQCVPAIPEKPDKNILKVTVDEPKPTIAKRVRSKKLGANFMLSGLSDEDSNIAITSYNFDYMGKPIGTFKTGSVERLTPFPVPLFFCALNDAASSWDCAAMFYRTKKQLYTSPDAALNSSHYDELIRVLLQIVPYTDTDFVDFKAYPENMALIDAMIARKKNETPADFNEWGIRKDSVYLPSIATLNGVSSYTGGIYTQKEGGPFYSFIENNQGKTVYIDATVHRNVNINYEGIGIYGVCPDEQSCTNGHWYDVKAGKGSVYTFDRTQMNNDVQIKGYWLVGETKAENKDTRNTLTGVAAPSGNQR